MVPRGERSSNAPDLLDIVKKTEISFLKTNYIKLRTIADFLDIPLDDVVNASLFHGLYKIWLPIARIIDEFSEWHLEPEEEAEKLLNLKNNFIKLISTTNKNFQKVEVIERKFKKGFSEKHFKSDLEHYKTFIEYVDTRLGEPASPLDKEIVKEDIIKKETPLKVKNTHQKPIPNNKPKEKKYLQILLKSASFAISFIAPTVLLYLILVVFLKWNYLAVLRYQPVFFLLLIIIMILVGILSGWISLFLTKRYQGNRRNRLDKREYIKLKREFNEIVPLSEFKKRKEGGTVTQWYKQFEKFLESKKKDN